MCKLAHRKRCRVKHAAKIRERLCNHAAIEGSGIDGLCSGQFALNFGFVGGITLSAVVREQGHFMMVSEMPENVIGTDLSPRIDGEELARFDPENSQVLTSKSLRNWRLQGGGRVPDSPGQARCDQDASVAEVGPG